MRPTSQQLSVRSARRQFFENGCAPHGLVPETILRSWQRCRGMGLDTTIAPSIEPLSTRELSDIRGRNEELNRLCRPELEALYADACFFSQLQRPARASSPLAWMLLSRSVAAH
jgi:transcriptional regulator of acetoin/glycerol metabolism